MKVLGIDNGLDGALVVIEEGSFSRRAVISRRIVMPVITGSKDAKREYDVPAVVRLISMFQPDHAYVERAQSMPKQGVSSTFSIGYGFGLMVGILTSLKVPYTIVHPRTWQKVMLRDVKKTDTKKAAAVVCRRLWPEIDWRKSVRARTNHDGLCDAALIGMFGWRELNGKEP
jgi:crossover junction endodeoxyribonuclease RuvC